MHERVKVRFWGQLHLWVKKHRKLLIVLSGVIALILASIVVFVFFDHKAVAPKPAHITKTTPIVKPKPIVYYSPLTGEPVADQAATTAPVTGVMIENSPDARPQSGIKNSGVVFEAIAEGGITRFMVLYQQEKPQLIGPVRSVRSYDLDWLAAFNASIAHVGGSVAALAEVRDGSFRDIDQFFNASYYYRATDRYAPHNVYTTAAKLDALNAAKGYTSSNFTGFTRVDAAPATVPSATQIAIHISGFEYDSTYAYDKTTNTYARSQAGAPHLDREDGQITPTVIVAMRVDETTIPQDSGHQQITTVGSGNANIFQNGTEQDVTWHKDTQAGQIYFTDAAGKDVPLVRGQTWIAAVPNGSGSVSWQ